MPRRIFFLTLLLLFSLSGASSAKDYVETPFPLPPVEAARTMQVPEGFNVTLFAGEPDVKQPIGFCIDDGGRVWVAEAYNYPNHGTKAGDRIVILEDVNNDGRFDKRTVFYDKLNYVTGVEVGFGGAWVMSPPYFYFIPDRDGDLKPDGKPQVLLDGFGNHANAHNLANGFAWGPDGWLYGTHGRTNWSRIGKPGTPDDQRVRFDGGVYRYHPVRHVWEPYADGTTNPWGIDWNDYGEPFVCNCVNPHLFHVIPGAHYEPWRNRESSQYAYKRIETIADHLHFVGKQNVRDGLGSHEEDAAGGGHAHCGTMIYLGDNWPDRYRNQVFMNNIHGRRINNDLLKRVGSGYVASHGADVARSQDPWFMGVTLQYGPDGAVFVSDWSDTGECHSVRNTRRQTGRIYKIAYGKPSDPGPNPKSLSNAELVERQLHRNDWHVRHARRLLHERAAAGDDMAQVHRQLHAMFVEQTDVPRKLRALWVLHVTGGLNDAFLVRQLDDADEYIRAWAARLLCEDGKPPSAALDRFRELAAGGDSPYVRLHLASLLQRLDAKDRWSIAAALSKRAEDVDDANLPQMLWYGIEPLVDDDLGRFVALAGEARIPLVRRHIARRAAEHANSEQGLTLLAGLLGSDDDAQRQLDLLAGIQEGLAGRRSVSMPRTWPDAYAKLSRSPSEVVRERALQSALVFDDAVALQALRRQAARKTASAAARNRAVTALVAKKPDNLAPLLLTLIGDPATRSTALRGIAEYDHPATASTIVKAYESFDAAARQDAVQTLASRPAWAMALMDAVEEEQIASTDLSAYTGRQLRSLGDARLTARVKALWGEVRATPAEKLKQIAAYKKRLAPDALERADRSAGRALFVKNCANCHTLFGTGGAIGPDITGSQRTNLDYVLENLVDPSSAVAKDFQVEVVATTSGRVLTGLIVSENKQALTIQTVNEKVVVPRGEIDARKQSNVSMMPDGLLKQLSTNDVRNLIAYLSGATQVPLPEEEAAGR